MAAPPRRFPRQIPRRAYFSVSIRYVIIRSPHPGSTNGGISKIRTWERCGIGKAIVACCRANSYSSAVQVSKHKITLQRNSFSARDNNSKDAYLIPTNCMIHTKKELWRKRSSVAGLLVFITGHWAWHNLRYIRSLERLWLIPHPSPLPSPPEYKQENSVERKALFQDPL